MFTLVWLETTVLTWTLALDTVSKCTFYSILLCKRLNDSPAELPLLLYNVRHSFTQSTVSSAEEIWTLGGLLDVLQLLHSLPSYMLQQPPTLTSTLAPGMLSPEVNWPLARLRLTFVPVHIMGDLDAAVLSRRRRATLAGARGVSVQLVNGRTAELNRRPVTVGVSNDNSAIKKKQKRDGSLEVPKSEKRKRKNDMSDRLR